MRHDSRSRQETARRAKPCRFFRRLGRRATIARCVFASFLRAASAGCGADWRGSARRDRVSALTTTTATMYMAKSTCFCPRYFYERRNCDRKNRSLREGSSRTPPLSLSLSFTPILSNYYFINCFNFILHVIFYNGDYLIILY